MDKLKIAKETGSISEQSANKEAHDSNEMKAHMLSALELINSKLDNTIMFQFQSINSRLDNTISQFQSIHSKIDKVSDLVGELIEDCRENKKVTRRLFEVTNLNDILKNTDEHGNTYNSLIDGDIDKLNCNETDSNEENDLRDSSTSFYLCEKLDEDEDVDEKMNINIDEEKVDRNIDEKVDRNIDEKVDRNIDEEKVKKNINGNISSHLVDDTQDEYSFDTSDKHALEPPGDFSFGKQNPLQLNGINIHIGNLEKILNNIDLNNPSLLINEEKINEILQENEQLPELKISGAALDNNHPETQFNNDRDDLNIVYNDSASEHEDAANESEAKAEKPKRNSTKQKKETKKSRKSSKLNPIGETIADLANEPDAPQKRERKSKKRIPKE